MGLLKLLPAGLKQKLLLSGLLQAIGTLEAQQFGKALNAYADAKWGKDVADPVQVRVATWLETVAKELRA